MEEALGRAALTSWAQRHPSRTEPKDRRPGPCFAGEHGSVGWKSLPPFLLLLLVLPPFLQAAPKNPGESRSPVPVTLTDPSFPGQDPEAGREDCEVLKRHEVCPRLHTPVLRPGLRRCPLLSGDGQAGSGPSAGQVGTDAGLGLARRGYPVPGAAAALETERCDHPAVSTRSEGCTARWRMESAGVTVMADDS